MYIQSLCDIVELPGFKHDFLQAQPLEIRVGEAVVLDVMPSGVYGLRQVAVPLRHFPYQKKSGPHVYAVQSGEQFCHAPRSGAIVKRKHNLPDKRMPPCYAPVTSFAAQRPPLYAQKKGKQGHKKSLFQPAKTFPKFRQPYSSLQIQKIKSKNKNRTPNFTTPVVLFSDF